MRWFQTCAECTHTYIADYVPQHYYRQLKPTYTVPLYGATTDLWGHHRSVAPLYGATNIWKQCFVKILGQSTGVEVKPIKACKHLLGDLSREKLDKCAS
jgi:hypothetical protein